MMQAFKSPIRIFALTSDRYPPFRVDVSVLFGQCLPGLGVLSDWVMQAQDESREEGTVPWGGGTIRVGRTDTGTTRRQRLWKHMLGMSNDLRALRDGDLRVYDVIQVKDKVLAAIPAIWSARRAGKAFVYWLSFPNPEASTYVARQGVARYPWLYRVRGWLHFALLYRLILPRCDHVFVQSEKMRQDLIGYGLDGKRMSAVPMGVLMSDFSGIQQRSAGDRALVCYLGSLAAERRLDFLVRCLAIVRRTHPDARLLFVGGAERPLELELITAEARRLGVADAVQVTGFLPRHQALQHAAAAAVCVSPFRPSPILDSTSPTKLVEYMALGRPVVANDHPEQRLVIGESGGGISVPYDEQAFAAAIDELLDDRARAEEMGRLGQAYVREFRDYPRIAETVAATYYEIVLTRATAGRTARSRSGAAEPGRLGRQ
jgi:glycosyltransferase involved in cell wall biosynthesis